MTTISPTTSQNYSSAATASSAERNPASHGVVEPRGDNSFRSEVANEDVSLTVQEIEQTVESLNDAMEMLRRGLNFRIDDDNGRTVIKVIDKETEGVIKQIPSEDVIKLVNHMQEMQSLLFDERV